MRIDPLFVSCGTAITATALLWSAAFAQGTVIGNGGVNTVTPRTHSAATVPGDRWDPKTTQAFINQAAYSSRAEIAEAHYVAGRTKSHAIKDFADQMIGDHGTALQALEQTAFKNGFVMPNGVDDKDRAELDKLKREKATRLDMTYSSAEEKGHREVVARFRRAAQNQSIAPAVREYAAKTLPTLEKHLHMAQRLVATESKGHRSAG